MKNYRVLGGAIPDCSHCLELLGPAGRALPGAGFGGASPSPSPPTRPARERGSQRTRCRCSSRFARSLFGHDVVLRASFGLAI